jgi:hypothetical protein
MSSRPIHDPVPWMGPEPLEPDDTEWCPVCERLRDETCVACEEENEGQ